MTPQRVTLLIVLFSMAAPLAGQDANRPSAETTIKQWASAINQNKADKLLAFYDPSDDLQVVFSSGVQLSGYKSLAKAYREDFRQVRFRDSIAKQLKTRQVGNTVIATFQHELKLRMANDAQFQVRVRTTTVLHLRKGQWKIVHEHSSPIRGVERMTPIRASK